MADTTTPFGNLADDESPFVASEPPDDFPFHPADDAYWQSLQAEHTPGPVETCPVCAPLLKAA